MKSFIEKALPFAAMVMVECGEVGMITLGKAAMNSGLSNLVYVVYYNALGTVLLLPNFVIHNCSSPTLAAALGNLIPAFTFLFAIIFSVIGAVIIAVGVYTVLWGQSTEQKLTRDDVSRLEAPTENTHLLQK
ncbi:hypothetical protein Ccrd_019204 [Cynara cardunculus var. scolymus]|uniref:WAT1-related protein n=1 Tax=Cynara cardunculus var. scolymus TaxID=59895 RepID=A0A103Y4S5_CYNCS|nr:hypothetical protein Ccrd_019204 [Cynara cardunculus var. scolymus]